MTQPASPPYLDPSLDTQRRVDDLLPRMTLREKVGQLVLADGRYDAEALVERCEAGSFLHILGEKTYALQKLAERSRLRIPLLFGIDAIHGHAFWPGATVFPTQLAISCSWEPKHARTMAKVTAREMLATGLAWTFSPVLCVARDLRWGRVGETFGEDLLLIADFATQAIAGYQGEKLNEPDSVAACAKHYAGYSETVGGRDATEAELSRRKLLCDFLPPFEQAVKAGCRTFMTAYQAIDGVPACTNQWLMVDVLRRAWGFSGMVVTDWDNVGRLCDFQRVVATKAEGVPPSVRAQNDMIMCTPEFYDAAVAAVESGELSESEIDRGVRRVLALKLDLGLFDAKRHTDPRRAARVVGCDEHRSELLPMALDSIVLLGNDGTLPLRAGGLKVALLGPNADDPLAQLGDWSFGSGQASFETGGHPREAVVTLRDALAAREGIQLTYERGCDVLDEDASHVQSAAALAADADVAVVVVGDTLGLIGERRDREGLDLTGGQSALLRAVHATGTPMVVVLINSKPLTIPWVKQHAAAVVEAWNPGMMGGEAIARVLLGEHNPSGRLSVSFARSVGSQPVHYQQIPGWHDGPHRYYDSSPLYAFGEGQSYTTFSYDALSVEPTRVRPGEGVTVRVAVRNTGDREGVETVQLYLNDVITSVTTPAKVLRGYRRVRLAPGERAEVEFRVSSDSLSLIGPDCEPLVEPGEFCVMVGKSSRDEDLLRATFHLVAE